jgi:hypothetical protein
MVRPAASASLPVYAAASFLWRVVLDELLVFLGLRDKLLEHLPVV